MSRHAVRPALTLVSALIVVLVLIVAAPAMTLGRGFRFDEREKIDRSQLTITKSDSSECRRALTKPICQEGCPNSPYGVECELYFDDVSNGFHFGECETISNPNVSCTEESADCGIGLNCFGGGGSGMPCNANIICD